MKKNKLLKSNLDYLVFFRVDGGNNIGLGHVIRCIALAQRFAKINIKSFFIIKKSNNQIEEIIKRNSFIVNNIGDVKDYREDAEKTIKIINNQSNKSILITDISNMDWMNNSDYYLKYLQIMKNHVKLLITIDGLTKDCISKKFLLPSDFVIIPYYSADRLNFIKDSKIKFLKGSKYFVFREEFKKIKNYHKKVNKVAKNILISMGGTDPFNYTSKIIKIISEINKTNLNIKILFGLKDLNFINKLKEDLKKIKNNNYEIIINTDNIIDLFLWADIAIIASGLTVYEAAVTNTPCIVISQYDFHDELINNFSKAGSIIPIIFNNSFNNEKLRDTIYIMLDNYNLRKKMCKNSRKIVDLKGVDRIIYNINKEYTRL